MASQLLKKYGLKGVYNLHLARYNRHAKDAINRIKTWGSSKMSDSNALAPATKAPIAMKADGNNNPVFDDMGALARWAERRVQAGGLPSFIKNGAMFESVYYVLTGLDLPVMASIGQTCVINGVVGIWGDLPQALCHRTGELEDCQVWLVDKDNNPQDPEKPVGFVAEAAICKVVRAGHKPTIKSFTKQQASEAGLLSKPGPWKQYTDIMLGHRARAYALRAAFPDALRGVKIRESDEFVAATDSQGDAMRSADGAAIMLKKLNSKYGVAPAVAAENEGYKNG